MVPFSIIFVGEFCVTIYNECARELFYTMTQIASLACGKSEWNAAYDFLTEIGIAVPEDFNLEMSYVDSMLDVVPGDMKCN